MMSGLVISVWMKLKCSQPYHKSCLMIVALRAASFTLIGCGTFSSKKLKSWLSAAFQHLDLDIRSFRAQEGRRLVH